MISRVRILGAGLIGTSIGLALKGAGITVDMIDSNPQAERLAQALVQGELNAEHSPEHEPDIVVVATPATSLLSVLKTQLSHYPNSTFIEVSSVKSNLLQEVQNFSAEFSQLVMTHPMAGREVSGAESARADLFVGRPWIVIEENRPVPAIHGQRARELIRLCSGVIIDMHAQEHDSAVAHISHLPQIISSALSRELQNAHTHELMVAGQGIRDVTRLGDSDPQLWADIVLENRRELISRLENFARELMNFSQSLKDENRVRVKEFFGEGQIGRSRLPGKHGGVTRNYVKVPIVIQDRPGQLGALFDDCAKAEINVEDLAIEHSPGQETGLITLAVAEKDGIALAEFLTNQGWNVHEPRR